MRSKKWIKWIMPKIKHGIPTKYGWVVYHPKNFILCENTDLGWGSFINAQCGVYIKNNVKIGPFCSILSANSINRTYGRIMIEEDVRIGAYTLILPNSIIKKGTVIKAKSIIYEKKGITYAREVLDSCGIRRIDR